MSGALSTVEQRIVAAAIEEVGRAIGVLERAVNIPSATLNLAGVREVGRLFAGEFEQAGLGARWVEVAPEVHRAGHLVCERRGSGPRILLIGHLDTVLEGAPYRREGDRAWGNGVSDMKGGNVIILGAIRALAAAEALDACDVTVFLAGDEEDPGPQRAIGRQELVRLGERSDFALGFENSVRDTATVARRSTTLWRLDVEATPGHSSHVFADDVGHGAIFETCRVVTAMHERLAGQQYLTFNPSVILGGTGLQYDDERNAGTADGKTNVVAKRAIVEGDLRCISNEQREEAKNAMREIAGASLPGTAARIAFTDGYPAMPPTERNYALLARFDQVSRDLGYGPIVALDPGVRGAGDISYVSPFAASLDGLGAKGEEEHAPGEHIDLTSFPMLIARAAVLIHRLAKG